MWSTFVQRNKLLLIFLSIVVVLVIAERLVNSRHVPVDPTEPQAEAPKSDSQKDEDAVTAGSRVEEDFPVTEITRESLITIAEHASAEIKATAEQALAVQQGSPAPDVTVQHQESLLSFEDRDLAVIELTVLTKSNGVQIDNAHVLRIYGFVRSRPISVSCARPSGRPLTLLSGDCGPKVSETFGVDLGE